MEQEFICKYCGRICKNILSLKAHENFCKLNPNRRDISGKNNPRYGKEPPNKRPKTALYKIQTKKEGSILINKTIEEIEEYKKDHLCCEICGKTDATLCIDHNHETNEFRGILCQSCNRFLGWFDHNKKEVEEYLKKKN